LPDGFPHAYGKLGYGLHPLQGLQRQVQPSAAHFEKQEFRIAQNSRQRIIQLVAEHLAEVTVVEHDADQAGQCLIAYVVPSGPGLGVRLDRDKLARYWSGPKGG